MNLTAGSVISDQLLSTQLSMPEKGKTQDGEQGAVTIEEPPIARLWFAGTRFAWLWLPLRLYLGSGITE